MDLYNERAETGLQCIAGAMPKFLLLSGAKKRKISKEKKRKDLAVIAKTPRLNHFFPAKLPSSNFEAVTLTTASKNVAVKRQHLFLSCSSVLNCVATVWSDLCCGKLLFASLMHF